MKSIIKIASLSLSLLLSQQSFASSVSGKIEYVLPHIGNYVLFNIVGASNTSLNLQGTNNNCITSVTGHFLVDLNQPTAVGASSNETGPAIYAALLAAQSQDKSIIVNGSDTCIIGRENVNWILVR